MNALPSGDDGAIAAEVLSPAEQARYHQRRGRVVLDPPPQPAPAPPSGLEFGSYELPPMSAEELSEWRDLVRKAKEIRRELRRERKRKRDHRPREPKQDPIDAAIARAHNRELQKAARTPERLWTDAMRQAVCRADTAQAGR